MKYSRLIITRHGQSIWNKENKFTGWSDIELTSKGILKSHELSNKLINNNIINNKIYTSELIRSIKTSEIIKENLLKNTNKNDIDITKSWRLNERNYGILEGVNRDEACKLYGKENINNIRKKYYYMPYIRNNKAIVDNNILFNNNIDTIIGESLNMIHKRLYPLWNEYIKNDLLYNNTILIVSHKNTIRTLMKIIEDLKIQEVENLDINNSDLIIYNFDKNFNLLDKNLLN